MGMKKEKSYYYALRKKSLWPAYDKKRNNYLYYY